MSQPPHRDEASPTAGRLPDFVIVGAMRCGTSALRYLLDQHPDCAVAEPELNFFSHRWPQGLDWYCRNFPDGKVAGEKSPIYLARPVSLVRMHRVIPNAKIVVRIRDPCKRFLSHFTHTNRLLPPQERFKGVRDFLQSRLSHDALWRGMYAAQLTTLFQLFPRDQILIVSNERMRDDTENTCRRVQEFLGLKPRELTAKAPDERDFPGAFVREQLAQYYAGPNEALSELLGEEITQNWTCPSSQ